MVFSPISITESFSTSITTIHYINNNQLFKILSPYPTFHRILQPQKNVAKFEPIEGDITLDQMLIDTHDEFLEFNDMGDFTDINFGDLEYTDKLDLEYYLCNGRAMDAYMMYYSRDINELLKEPYFDDEIAYGSNSDDENMCESVRAIALRHYSDQSITSTCQHFLSMISNQTSSHYASLINIETKVARKINSYIKEDVSNIFYVNKADEILKLLEKATLDDWQLVHEYCKVISITCTNLITF